MSEQQQDLFSLTEDSGDNLDATSAFPQEPVVEVLTGVLVHLPSERTVGPVPQGSDLVRYERTVVEPVRRLNAALNDILDVDAHPDREPEEALSELRTAMDTFHEESANWL